MSLQNSLQETVKEFEKTISPSQLKELEAVSNLFDEMVSKGLIAPPSYDLEPIGTIMTNIPIPTKL